MKNVQRSFVILSIFCVMGFVALCAYSSSATQRSKRAALVSAQTNPGFDSFLERLSWNMAIFQGQQVGHNGYSILFKDGKMVAHICNDLSAEYELQGNVLHVTDLSRTKFECSDEVMQLEDKFVQGLMGEVLVSDENGHLYLLDAKGQVVVFVDPSLLDEKEPLK